MFVLGTSFAGGLKRRHGSSDSDGESAKRYVSRFGLIMCFFEKGDFDGIELSEVFYCKISLQITRVSYSSRIYL